MNRFFSKLDLRDIKIDPSGTRFPPDADEYEADAEDQQSQDESVDAHSPNASSHAEVMSEATTADAEEEWKSSEPEIATAPEPIPHAQEQASHGYANGAANGTAYIGADVDYVDEQSGEVLKVSARSRPSAVAGAIAGVVRENGRAEVQAIGAGATNQAVKAVAIARDYLRETGIEAICLPAFIDVLIDNEDRTAIRLVVEPR